jgi:hypothetical protein
MASGTSELDPFIWILFVFIVLGSLAMTLPSVRDFLNSILAPRPWGRPLKKEGFYNSDVGYPTTQLCDMPLTTADPRPYGPADATLSKPKVPYHLLGDYIKPAQERIANLTSECAYIADGERLIEKTGSYGQITNNYKRKNPDNGSTLLHELSVSFYE